MSADLLRGGQIVIADWRDGLPKEPNKRRPGIVIEDHALFPPSYQTVILVPLTEDANLATPNLAVHIIPTIGNGCDKPCWALATHAAATSKGRITAAPSHITPDQLATIRLQVALAIGFEAQNKSVASFKKSPLRRSPHSSFRSSILQNSVIRIARPRE